MKLQQRFIFYTIIIILVSVFIGFLISNVLYVAFVREQMNNRYLKIAEQIGDQLEEHGENLQSSFDYLQTMGNLGYQIALVNEDGEMVTFGAPFKNEELNEPMYALFKGEETYYGNYYFNKTNFMMGHFKNDIKNTVGKRIDIHDENWALFIRSNNHSFFTEFHLVIFGFIIAVFISSIIGILFMSRSLTKSLIQLTNATQEIANHNFDFPLKIKRNDEIGQLADSFRLMQKRLANTDKTRKKFINNVSHDFQTPLLNILGYSELLERELTSSEGKKYNNIIQTEAKRLSNLTKQLLILTSIDEGTYPINKEMVRVDEQLKQVVHSMLWRIEDKGLEIEIDLQPVIVYGDRSLLINIWENLIGNAIKYNKEYGEISIRCYERDKKAIVIIKDTGVGIEKELLKQIFERFYRVDKARNKDGMGLGLSIVKEVLSYHHASVDVKSKVNEGTTFTITFPKYFRNNAENEKD